MTPKIKNEGFPWMDNKKKWLIGAVVLIIFAALTLDPGQYLSLDTLQRERQSLVDFRDAHPWGASALYFLLYVSVIGISIPGATVLTLAGGAVFGFWWGIVLVSFASSIGSTMAFLVSRYLLRDWVQQKFPRQFKVINEGVGREGAFYLFSLRLVPLFPLFMINLVVALTSMTTGVFYLVSQIGMLAGTAVYIFAGTQLASIHSASEIFTPPLIVAFTVLGLFPLLAKRFIDGWRSYRSLAPYTRPKKFDYNLIVIGAGSAGLVCSLIAATVKAKVALIEKNRMGGDCLNTGCVPSKALLRSAKINHYISRAEEFGLRYVSGQADFDAVMNRVRQVIATIEPHDSVERYTGLGVDCLQGEAVLRSPYEVEVEGKVITTRNIVIASGAGPLVPPFPGLEKIEYLTSDSVWGLEELPKNLLVMGAGPIGCELAQAFQRLGANVTLMDMAPVVLPREDRDVSEFVADQLRNEGITLLLDHKTIAFEDGSNGVKLLVAEHQGQRQEIKFENLLVAIGRRAHTAGLGLQELGIELTNQGTIVVDDRLRTRFPNVYACGDVAGPYQFTHMAAHQAWYASVNALLGNFKQFKVDYSVVPWAIFTDPEVARLGLSEEEAQAGAIAYEVTRFDLGELDRAIVDEEAKGFIKVLTPPGKDRILGVVIVGYHASDLIAPFVLAMKYRLGLGKILGAIHPYPTMAEANKFVAGEWRKAHAPETLLNIAGRYHAWRRK